MQQNIDQEFISYILLAHSFQAKFKNRVFVILNMRYAAYFPEYSQYFGIALKILKSMYGMTNSGKLFADELTEWIIEEGFMQS